MSYNPQNPNGQATSANSSPVVVASDQGTLLVQDSAAESSLSTIAGAVSSNKTQNNVAQIGGAAISLGQTASSTSLPVVFSSDNGDQYITGQSAQTAVVNNILTTTSGTAATDCLGYRTATVQVVSTGTAGAYTFEGSNDNINFQIVPVVNLATVSGTLITAAITATSSQLIYSFPITFRYLRLRISTAITGGSIQTFTRLSQQPYSNMVTPIGQNSYANLAASSYIAYPSSSTIIASSAITTTTTTAMSTIAGAAIVVQVNCTAVTGTSPTLDIALQESLDAGVTYKTIYQFPRITAALAAPTASLYSPPIPVTGVKFQLVQTVSGTSPSFTRAVFTNYVQASVTPFVRQIYDRTVSLTATGASTVLLNSDCTGKNAQISINVGTVTTAPAVQLQVSDDGGTSWYSIGSPLTAVASSTVTAIVTNVTAQLFRVNVTTAGSGVTAGYVLVKTF